MRSPAAVSITAQPKSIPFRSPFTHLCEQHHLYSMPSSKSSQGPTIDVNVSHSGWLPFIVKPSEDFTVEFSVDREGVERVRAVSDRWTLCGTEISLSEGGQATTIGNWDQGKTRYRRTKSGRLQERSRDTEKWGSVQMEED